MAKGPNQSTDQITAENLERFWFRNIRNIQLDSRLSKTLNDKHPHAEMAFVYQGRKKNRYGNPLELIYVRDDGHQILYLDYQLNSAWKGELDEMIDLIAVMTLHAR